MRRWDIIRGEIRRDSEMHQEMRRGHGESIYGEIVRYDGSIGQIMGSLWGACGELVGRNGEIVGRLWV